ncbi:hypothetical protein MKW94_000270 [Papaver nudicaule]|uniref:Bidirectional sugar transporter SWEET n=1 Tax=Papaver nudicaule TaxID=74823 RepID=A0AA41VUZ6_PAPNU|nr:hypothetical protein [Papaver nudicaule]
MKFKGFLTTSLGYVGNILFLCSFAAPIPKFREIVKKKTVKDFSLNPCLASVLSCGKMVLYGLPFFPYNINFMAVSVVGLVLQFMYIMVYLLYANKEERRYVLDMLAIETAIYSVLVGSLTFCLRQATNMEKRSVVGLHSFISGTGMQITMPLDSMMTNIKKKSVEYLSVYLLLANFVNSGIWFAFLGFDHFIVVTSGLASVLALIQLILHATYYNSTLARNVDGNHADGSTLQIDSEDQKQQQKARSRRRRVDT